VLVHFAENDHLGLESQRRRFGKKAMVVGECAGRNHHVWSMEPLPTRCRDHVARSFGGDVGNDVLDDGRPPGGGKGLLGVDETLGSDVTSWA